MITLINGPYNGREIDDSGAVVIRMAIYDGGEKVGAKVGTAFYEPNPERTQAFWDRNEWDGIIEERIPTEGI